MNGKGKYTGTASAEYILKDAKNTSAFVKTKVMVSEKTYTRRKVTLKPDDIKVSTKKGSALKFGENYEIIESSYKDNIKKGTAQITLREKVTMQVRRQLNLR